MSARTIDPYFIDQYSLRSDWMEIDRICSVVPVLNIVTSLVDIMIKLGLLLCCDKTIKSSHYFIHLKQKSFTECFILALPVLGPMFIYLHDLKKEELIKQLNLGKIDYKKLNSYWKSNPEVILAAVRKTPTLILDLDPNIEGYRTLALEAIKLKPGLVRKMDPTKVDSTFWVVAVKVNGEVIKFLPKDKFNLNKTLEQNGMLIKHIEKDDQHEDQAIVAVKQNYKAYSFLNPTLKENLAVCKAAIRANYLAYRLMNIGIQKHPEIERVYLQMLYTV